VEGDAQTVMPETATGPIRVAGPAREVAAELRAEGFDARVTGGEVLVRLAGERVDEEQAPEADRLQAVLAERGPGRVAVRIEP